MTEVTKEYIIQVFGQGIKEVVDQLTVMNATLEKSATVKQNVGKKSKELYRNLQGTAGATSNSTKAFSKMQQGMTGLVPIYASVAANVFALTAAFGALSRAADFAVLSSAAEQFGIRAGTSLTTTAKSMRELTFGAISTKDALTQASLAASAGFDTSTIEKLTVVSRNASIAMGRDMTDALNRVFRGAIKAEPELLDELGIILRLQVATKKYATELNKNVNSLTTFEKQQAVVNEVIAQGTEKFGELTDAVDANPYSKLASTYSDLLNETLGTVNKVLKPFIDFFSENIESLTAILLIFANSILRKAIPVLQQFGLVTENYASRALRVATIVAYQASKANNAYARAAEDANNRVSKSYGNLGREIRSFSASVANELIDKGQKVPKGLQQLLGLPPGTQEQLVKFKNVFKDVIRNAQKGWSSLGLTTQQELTKTQKYLDKATVAINVHKASVDRTGTSYQRLSAQVGAFVGKLKAGALATGALTISEALNALAVGWTKGFSGVFKLLGETETRVTKLGKSFGLFSRLMAGGTSAIFGLTAAFARFVPWLAYTVLGFQAVMSILQPYTDYLGITSKNSRDLSEANKTLSEATEELNKKSKYYNDILSHLPDTIENVNKRLNHQISTLQGIDSALATIIDTLNKGDFGYLDKLLGVFGFGGVENARKELENLTKALRGQGLGKEIDALLRQFGEIKNIPVEKLDDFARALDNLRTKTITTAQTQLEISKSTVKFFEDLDKYISAFSDDLPKLDSSRQTLAGIAVALETADKFKGDGPGKFIEQLNALSPSSLQLLDISSVKLQEMASLTEKNLALQKRLGEIRQQIAERKTTRFGDIGIEELYQQETVLSQIENINNKVLSSFETDLTRALTKARATLIAYIKAEEEYVSNTEALNTQLQTGAKYETDKAAVLVKLTQVETEYAKKRKLRIAEDERATKQRLEEARAAQDREAILRESIRLEQDYAEAQKIDIQTKKNNEKFTRAQVDLLGDLHKRYSEGQMILPDYIDQQQRITTELYTSAKAADISEEQVNEWIVALQEKLAADKADLDLQREIDAQRTNAINITENAIKVLDSLKTAQQKYYDEVTKLSYAFALGALNIEQFQEALARLDPNVDKLVDAGHQIESSFADAFESVFDKGVDSFKDLTKSILNIFRRMLAEMAAEALARPIVVGLIQSIGGAFTSQAAGAAAGNILAGQSVNAIGGGSFLPAGLAVGASSFGAGLSAGFSGGFGALGALNAQAASLGVAPGLATQIGVAAGAAIPYIAAAAAIDKITGGALFGTKWKKVNSDINLLVDELTFTGTQLDKYKKKKALFGGTKTKYKESPLSDELQSFLTETSIALQSSLRSFGNALGEDLLTKAENFDFTETVDITKTRYVMGRGFQKVTETITRSMLDGLSADPEKFQKQFGGILKKMFGSIIDNAEVQNALKNINFNDINKGLQDLAFAVDFVSGNLFGLKEITTAEAAINDLNNAFDELSVKAKSLGLDTTALEEARLTRLQKLTDNFNNDISSAILAIQDPLQAELTAQEKIGSERLKNAIDLGADLVNVELLNSLERQEILNKYAEIEQDRLNSIADFNADILAQTQEIRRLRGLDGLDLELEQLQIEFEKTSAEASSLGADLLLVEELYAEKRFDIIEANNKTILKELTDFNKTISNSIASYILSPLEYALYELQDTAQERIDNATRLGADLVEVEYLNLLDRKKILEDFAKDYVAALGSVSDYLDELSFSSVSPLKISDQLELAQSLYDQALLSAQAGDINSIQSLPDLSQRLLELSQSFFGGTEQFKTLFDTVTTQLGDLVSIQQDPVVEEIQKNSIQSIQNTTQIIDALREIRSELSQIRENNENLNNDLLLIQSGAGV